MRFKKYRMKFPLSQWGLSILFTVFIFLFFNFTSTTLCCQFECTKSAKERRENSFKTELRSRQNDEMKGNFACSFRFPLSIFFMCMYCMLKHQLMTPLLSSPHLRWTVGRLNSHQWMLLPFPRMERNQHLCVRHILLKTCVAQFLARKINIKKISETWRVYFRIVHMCIYDSENRSSLKEKNGEKNFIRLYFVFVGENHIQVLSRSSYKTRRSQTHCCWRNMKIPINYENRSR